MIEIPIGDVIRTNTLSPICWQSFINFLSLLIRSSRLELDLRKQGNWKSYDILLLKPSYIYH
jgi:hypothetical protein